MRAKHSLSPRDCLTHTKGAPLNAPKIMLCTWRSSPQLVHYDLLLARWSIPAGLYSQQLVCNRRRSRINQHWLISSVYFSSKKKLNPMWRGWLDIPYYNFARRQFAIHLTSQNILKQITTCPFSNNHFRDKCFSNEAEFRKALTDLFASKSLDFNANTLRCCRNVYRIPWAPMIITLCTGSMYIFLYTFLFSSK